MILLKCMQKSARNVLDTANIVRDGVVPPITFALVAQPRANSAPPTAAPEIPDAIESEIEGTTHDFIRGIGSHRNSDAL